MYQAHYNLREMPFQLMADPRYLYLTSGHREALSNLEYGLFAAKPLAVLIGEAGTGKTTLLRTALQSERCRTVRCVYVNNPTLTRDEFINTLATRFELGVEAAQSKAVLLERLEPVLLERRSRGQITALVVDEAQSLSIELLEEVRLLANIETPTEKLLPLVLVGQPELGARLEEPALRQLKQRVVLRCALEPFAAHETAAYIASRIRTAGGIPSRLFTQEAVTLIHEYSGGIARTVNVICDNALVSGMALDRQPVDSSVVLEVCRDFALRRNAMVSPAAATTMPEHKVGPRPPLPAEGPAASAGAAQGGQELEPGLKPARFKLFGAKWR